MQDELKERHWERTLLGAVGPPLPPRLPGQSFHLREQQLSFPLPQAENPESSLTPFFLQIKRLVSQQISSPLPSKYMPYL